MSQERVRKRRRLAQAITGGQLSVGPLENSQSDTLDQEVEEEGAGAPDLTIPSDTVAATHLLKAQFPKAAQTAPLILRSQLYSIVQDRTTVDRDLDESRQQGRLREIKLPSTVDDYAYILHEDYEACIDTAFQNEQAKGGESHHILIFTRFKELVLPRHKEASITHVQLLNLLSAQPGSRGSGASEAVTDKQISLLLSTGLLTRQVGKQNSYLFAVAGAGRLVISITRGRKELLAALARRRYKEAFLKDMEKWKLRGSCLDMRWHIRDLLGRGHVSQVTTTSGPLIRLVKKE